MSGRMLPESAKRADRSPGKVRNTPVAAGYPPTAWSALPRESDPMGRGGSR